MEVFSSIPGGSVAPVLGYQVDSGHPTGQPRSLRSSRTNGESLYNNHLIQGFNNFRFILTFFADSFKQRKGLPVNPHPRFRFCLTHRLRKPAGVLHLPII